MNKKNMQSIVGALSSVAEDLPTQNVQPLRSAIQKTAVQAEPSVQFSFSLRKSLRKQLARLADENDMTMRAFILNALEEKGLQVTPEDVVDQRRGRGDPIRTSIGDMK